jgi:8-oxo-dGTP pyrophosphatase MutT (NUDIX family)
MIPKPILMPLPDPHRVRAALTAHSVVEHPALPGRTNHVRAGVLVPLVWRVDRVEVLLTLRSPRLQHHPGEVCFPGGRPEERDADLQATAHREAREELGISSPRALGRLSSMPVYTSDHRLEPFVAQVEDADLRPNPGEVARVLRQSLGEVLGQTHIDAVPYQAEGRSALSPVFLPMGELLFGATAHTLLELVRVLAPLWGRPVPPLRPGRFSWEDLLQRRIPDPL